MLNEEGTLYKVSIEYNRLVSEKITRINEQLISNRRNIDLFSSLIIKSANSVNPNPILSWLFKVKTFSFTYNYNKEKIDELYKDVILSYVSDYKVESNKFIHIINDHNNDNLKIILKYYEKLKNFCILEYKLITRLAKMKLYNIKPITVRYLFKTIFMYCSHELLRSNRYITLPYDICIRVTGKTRPVKYLKHKVDYGESFIALKAIASEIKPDLLDSYNKGNLKYREFIKLMKPYVYDKDTNPTAKKWIVRDNKKFDFWLTIWSRFSNLEGIENYNITPTKFINPAKIIPRTQARILEMIKDIEGLITTDLIGLMDKINMLEKNHLDYCLNTLYHNIEI